MSNSKQHISKSKLWIRILCLFLAVIMVGSVAYLAVSLIMDAVRHSKPTGKAVAAVYTASTPVFISTDNFYTF